MIKKFVKAFFLITIFILPYANAINTPQTAQEIESFSQESELEKKAIKDLERDKSNLKIHVEQSKATHKKEIFEEEKYKKWTNSIKPFTLKKIKFVDLVDYKTEDFEKFYKDYIGTQVDGKKLAEITGKISKFYVQQNYLLTHPYIAYGQNFKNGEVTIKIINGGIRKVVIIGDNRKNSLLEKYKEKITHLEQPVKITKLMRYLELIENIPGITIEHITFKLLPDDIRTSETELIDLIIVVQEEKNSVDLKFTNNVSTQYGDYRAKISSDYFSPFKYGDFLSLNLSVSNVLAGYKNLAAAYDFPINSEGTRVNAFMSILESKIVNSNNSLTQLYPSRAYSSSLNITHPWILKKNFSFETFFTLSANYDRSNNMLGKYSNLDEYNYDIGVNTEFKDKLKGRNFAQVQFNQGLPISRYYYYPQPNSTLTNYNPDKTYKNFSGRYFRLDRLPYNFGIFTKIVGQYSFDVTPTSAQINFGGQGLVRGYNNYPIAASSGVGASIEPNYTYTTSWYYLKQIKLFAFYDYGRLYPKKNELQRLNFPTGYIPALSSTGIGITPYLAGDLHFNVTYAKRLSMKTLNALNNGVPQKKSQTTFTVNHTISW